MERLKRIKENLVNCVESQINGNMQEVNTKELGEAIDMIKDMSEAIYYCNVSKAMEEREEEEKYSRKYYTPYVHYPDYTRYRDMDRDYGKMYYHDSNMTHNDGRYTTPSTSYPTEMRDVREGKSPVMRKYYMESKEMHHGKEKQIEELERYLKELSEDITEMISGATTEEKTILKQKLAQLTNKIA